MNSVTGIWSAARAVVLSAPLVLAPITAAMADSYPGFNEGRNQGVSPIVENGIVTFTLHSGDCSSRPYGDGRGESDCWNGASRSRLNSRKLQSPRRSYEYRFDFRVAEGFDYDGRGWGKVDHHSRLSLAMWQRVRSIKNEMYFLYLETVHGLTFAGRVCVPPERLSEWNSFSMKVTWSAKREGVLVVRCNGNLVYSRRGPNLVPSDCGTPMNSECKPKLQKLSEPIQWQVGPRLNGSGGPRYKEYGFPSRFSPFPESGITVSFRNLKYREIDAKKVK